MTPESLKAARTQAGFTAAHLAEACGVDVRTVHRWEDGTRAIGGLAQKAIAAALSEAQAEPKAGGRRASLPARKSSGSK